MVLLLLALNAYNIQIDHSSCSRRTEECSSKGQLNGSQAQKYTNNETATEMAYACRGAKKFTKKKKMYV